MEIVNHAKTQSAVDISRHGHLGRHVRIHVVAEFKNANKNSFLIRSMMIFQSRKELVRQIHAKLRITDVVENEIVVRLKKCTLHLIKRTMGSQKLVLINSILILYETESDIHKL